jgi:hypothetical protein
MIRVAEAYRWGGRQAKSWIMVSAMLRGPIVASIVDVDALLQDRPGDMCDHSAEFARPMPFSIPETAI